MGKVLIETEQEQLLETLVEAQGKLPRHEQRDFKYSPAYTRAKGAIPRSKWIKAMDEGRSVLFEGKVITKKEDIPWNLDHDLILHPGLPNGSIETFQSDIDALTLHDFIRFRDKNFFFITPLGKGYNKNRHTAVAEIESSANAQLSSSSVNFSFVADARIAKILQRDYAELRLLDPATSTKAVLVLSGSIIEGLLFDALVASGKWTFEEACGRFLKDMIGPALNKGIITEDKLTDALRKYRNLIHPAREIKESIYFEESDAKLAKPAVDIIIREVREWHSKRSTQNQSP